MQKCIKARRHDWEERRQLLPARLDGGSVLANTRISPSRSKALGPVGLDSEARLDQRGKNAGEGELRLATAAMAPGGWGLQGSFVVQFQLNCCRNVEGGTPRVPCLGP